MSKKTTIGKSANSRQANQTNEKNVNQPSISEAKRGGTFDGDLRQLPQTKPIRQARPKLREPKVKPRIFVKDANIEPDK